jgi:hypothetical protein
VIELLKDEELIKKTKPHSASFLSSSIFWIGIITVVISIYGILVHIANLIVVSLLIVGFVLIALGDLRRVWAHTYYITNKRIVSHYAFIRKLHREIYLENIVDVKVEQGIFGKISGYTDVWLYGYQKGWVIGRMRGVHLGDCHIITNRAWKTAVEALKQKPLEVEN